MNKFVLNPKEAATYLGVGENKIRKLCENREIKAMRSGRNWKIPIPMLERYAMEKAEKGEQI